MNITLPEKCYPRTNWRTLDGKELPSKIVVSKEQFELVINEIRSWVSINDHLELNLGAHFVIKKGDNNA